jgi:hypothetical protein
MPCSGCISHFKAYSTAYSVVKEDYCSLTLLAETPYNNRVLKEFAFYCLKRLYKLHTFAGLKHTSNYPAAVREHCKQMFMQIAVTGTLPLVPATHFYSKEFVKYMMAILSLSSTPRQVTPVAYRIFSCI